MRNELENLEDLSMNILKGLPFGEAPLMQLGEEKDRVLRAIMKNVLQLPSKKQTRYYIRWYQNRLVKLADNLCRDSNERHIEPQVQLLALELVEEFRLTFKNDFDNSQSIPLGELFRERENTTITSEEIRISFETAGVSENLIAIVLIPVNEFTETTTGPVTFEQYHYLQKYLSELQQTDFKNSLHSQVDLTVMDLLVRLNYNHVRFLNFAIDHITRSIKERTNPQEKLALLNEYLKMVNQVPEMKELSYQAALPSVKAQLNRWLSEEVDCLKNTSMEEPEKVPLLKLNLSVSQMAYLTSLFFKQGVFMEPVKAKVFRSMTQTFSSRETARISPGSFTTKSKEPGDSAVMGVRKLLRAMVQEIDEYLN